MSKIKIIVSDKHNPNGVFEVEERLVAEMIKQNPSIKIYSEGEVTLKASGEIKKKVIKNV